MSSFIFFLISCSDQYFLCEVLLFTVSTEELLSLGEHGDVQKTQSKFYTAAKKILQTKTDFISSVVYDWA